MSPEYIYIYILYIYIMIIIAIQDKFTLKFIMFCESLLS